MVKGLILEKHPSELPHKSYSYGIPCLFIFDNQSAFFYPLALFLSFDCFEASLHRDYIIYAGMLAA